MARLLPGVLSSANPSSRGGEAAAGGAPVAPELGTGRVAVVGEDDACWRRPAWFSVRRRDGRDGGSAAGPETIRQSRIWSAKGNTLGPGPVRQHGQTWLFSDPLGSVPRMYPAAAGNSLSMLVWSIHLKGGPT
jgi:hypothetical protein